jgi:hypothetical protein
MPVRNANCLDDPPRCLPPVVACPIAAMQGLLHDIYKPKPAGAASAQGTQQLEVPARTLLTIRVVPAQFCEFLTSRLHGNDDGASMTVSRQSVSAAMPLRPPVCPSSQRMQARVRVHCALQYMPAHARPPPARTLTHTRVHGLGRAWGGDRAVAGGEAAEKSARFRGRAGWTTVPHGLHCTAPVAPSFLCGAQGASESPAAQANASGRSSVQDGEASPGFHAFTRARAHTRMHRRGRT